MRSGEDARKVKGTPKPTWHMGSEAKRALSHNLGMFPEVVLETVADIIVRHRSEMPLRAERFKNEVEGDFDVDINFLNNDTLWALDLFASGGVWVEGRKRKWHDTVQLVSFETPLPSSSLRYFSILFPSKCSQVQLR